MIRLTDYRLKPDPQRPGVPLGLDLDGLTPLRVRTVRRTPRPDLDEALAAPLNLLDPPGHTSDG
jgi:hypothetical protein